MIRIAASVVALAVAWSPAPHAAAQSTGPTVLAGNGEPGYAVNLFMPDSVTVVEGSTVTWRNAWFEGHQVAFLGGTVAPLAGSPAASAATNPGVVIDYQGIGFLSSGTLRRNESFQTRFPKAGTYAYLCLTHRGPPAQTGTVVVVPAGSPGATTQVQADAAATKTYSDTLTALKAEATKLGQSAVQQSRNADDTSTWRVVLSGGKVNTSDVQQFFPSSLNVRVGDTVVWEGATTTPHPVAFLGGAGALPAGANPQALSLPPPRAMTARAT